jgi:hypothetical protein
VIEAKDLTGVDSEMARRIIAVARSFAPCLDSLTEGNRTDAIAILTGVANEALDRGARHVKSERIGPAAVEYTSAVSWFSGDDKAALRALCGAASTGGLPIGSFPRPGIIGRLWPGEDC